MIDMKNEQWLREKYEEVCGKNPEEYALISLKIKRFRIFNRLFGREAGDRLVEKVGIYGNGNISAARKTCRLFHGPI